MTVVVLAMDGSPDSVAAARRLASRPLLAEPLSVHVAHVSPVLGSPGLSRSALDAENRSQADSAFAAAEAVLPGMPLVRHWLHGDPAAELAQLADTLDADAIVLGAKGRGPFVSALLGSVVSAVLAQATVPVIVVNPRAAQARAPAQA
ncbi:universal stress protein [Cupriavidus sp. P-10]|uniref:universal stress protein n=1 Tax=unclassified Cupriavidus TaxID=2640874 RepID=UPI000E2EA2C3|nr:MULTISPECIES: universal stress protein [unclassified Cupriavidus]BDB24329.1 universal stress protein [Cupriavidus sp. P-10]